MTIRYSDMPEAPRPCRFCGADTALGQPGHDGSQQHFDEEPCERHQDGGMYADPECDDCLQDPWYVCGSCAGDIGIRSQAIEIDDLPGPVH